MNPHDQLAKPAAHRVYERLGVDDVWTLLRREPEESPEASLAWYLAASVTAIDGVHRELTAAAKTAVETLSPVERGEYAGQPTDEQGTPRRALREVQLGDLWMRENVLCGKEVIHGNGRGAPVKAETVEPLVAAGLIAADTATDAARVGRMVSLTPVGRKALEASPAARLREAAALYRSVAPAAAPPAASAPLAASPAWTSSSARTR
ncbi:hypothetical protein ACFVXH_28870 [Kitasatospora sp. NPDC058184]|uniref:hypothetical protein n=1 Tax=unclassified Kitasatospora TaxID=2633591 RepID=UPI0036ABFB9A